jgi:hypothetical protein
LALEEEEEEDTGQDRNRIVELGWQGWFSLGRISRVLAN